MIVKELKEFLKNCDEEMEIYIANYEFQNEVGDELYDKMVTGAQITTNDHQEKFVRLYNFNNLSGN
jgi:hypothetical protein